MRHILTSVLTAVCILSGLIAGADDRNRNPRPLVMRQWTVKQQPTAQGQQPPFSVVVDSIMCRGDVTRLYGSIQSKPNTSGCINAVMLRNADTALPAVDTDGFDLEHRFQWEEDGTLPIELDFGAMRPSRELTIDFITDKGAFSWTLTAPERKGGNRQKRRR